MDPIKVLSPLILTVSAITPTPPDPGFIALYPKANGNLYILLSNGTEIQIN
jgi:hypothetical protein